MNRSFHVGAFAPCGHYTCAHRPLQEFHLGPAVSSRFYRGKLQLHRMYPWYILVDQFPKVGISPVLIGVQDAVIANQLRRGLLDAHLFTLLQQNYDENDPNCGAFSRWNGFCALPERTDTEELERTRSVLKIRREGFYFWRRWITVLLNRDRAFPEDAGWEVAREVEKSTPEHLSEGLLDYAHASGREPADAYAYLKIVSEETANRRLLVRALAEGYAAKINACTAQAEVAALCRKMGGDFRM